MSTIPKVVMGVLFGVLAIGFLYLQILARRVSVATPALQEEAVRSRLNAAALESPSNPPQSVTLYFASDDRRQLLEEKRPMALAAGDPDRIRQVLLALIEGSHFGHNRMLPPSTEVRAVFLATDGTAYIDLSSGVLSDFTPGIGSETLAVYSIANSLAANVSAVKQVKILIQGQEVETLDGHAALDGTFTPNPAWNAPGA
jgi:hypothetical protein